MKKFTQLIIAAMTVMLALTLTSCGKKALTIWVGSECVDFYQAKCDAYIESYNASHDKAFPSKIEVKGVDAGAAAAQYLNDTDAGPDIFTIPHDNMGKLTAGTSSIMPITGTVLLKQIQDDNPESFIKVVQSTVSGNSYYFGVPYIAQSLVLYYNTEALSAEDVKTWEAISAKATALSTAEKSVKAADVLGTDGYNNSFLLLSEYYNASGVLSTSVKLYDNGTTTCKATGDDTIAAMKWGRRYFQKATGSIDKAGSSGWETELKDGYTLALIGGAWNYKACQAALGSKLGVAILPQFTITADDAYGSIAAGTVYQSGTFGDCKCFVIKKGSKYQDYLEDIVTYLSSKSMQEEAFSAVANLPAYKNAANEFAAMKADTLDAKLAACEVTMFAYGMAQPFGYVQKYNTWFYSKGAPDLIYAMLKNTDNVYPDDASVKDCLTLCEKIWTTGEK